MTGWIKLWNKITHWEWYTNGNTFRLFLHLLIRANYQDKKWHGIVIKRGQIVTSIKKLSEELRLSVQQTRTAISNLQSTKEITIETTNRYSLITVENYEKYQDTTIENNKQDNKQVNKQPNKQITSNLTTTKEERIKEDINNKKEKYKKEKSIDQLITELPIGLQGVFKDFIEMRKQLKAPVKTQRQFTLLANKLNDLSGGDTETGKRIIEQSIMNGWKSLYEVKEKKKPISFTDAAEELRRLGYGN